MYLYIITNGNLTSVSQEKANVLNLLFSIVFENEGTGELPVFPDRPFAEPLCSIDISIDKISKATDKIKATKSKGPDNIHPKFVKECKKSMLLPLQLTFTKSLNEGKIPDVWEVGHISATHKNGPRTKAEHYRPINLTSLPGKILERLIRDEIVDYMTKNNFFSPEQHGFMSGETYTTQLLEFLDLTEILDSGNDIDVIYLDF